MNHQLNWFCPIPHKKVSLSKWWWNFPGKYKYLYHLMTAFVSILVLYVIISITAVFCLFCFALYAHGFCSNSKSADDSKNKESFDDRATYATFEYLEFTVILHFSNYFSVYQLRPFWILGKNILKSSVSHIPNIHEMFTCIQIPTKLIQ